MVRSLREEVANFGMVHTQMLERSNMKVRYGRYGVAWRIAWCGGVCYVPRAWYYVYCTWASRLRWSQVSHGAVQTMPRPSGGWTSLVVEGPPLIEGHLVAERGCLGMRTISAKFIFYEVSFGKPCNTVKVRGYCTG